MNPASRLRFLHVVLVLAGLVFLLGVYPLRRAWWPSGWRWHPHQPEYGQMILRIFATLGVFLLIAARNPLQHLSIVWFTVRSSLIHAGIMAVPATKAPREHGRLVRDIPALVIVAVALARVTLRGDAAELARTAASRDLRSDLWLEACYEN